MVNTFSDRFTPKKPGPPVHDDLCAVTDKHGVIRHGFNADAPNLLWLSDIQCRYIPPAAPLGTTDQMSLLVQQSPSRLRSHWFRLWPRSA